MSSFTSLSLKDMLFVMKIHDTAFRWILLRVPKSPFDGFQRDDP